MNPFKHYPLAAVCSAVVIFNFSSCKYEDGPSFSLRTKKGRLTGEWELKKVDGQRLDNELIFEFDKDGDMSITYSYSYYSYYYGYISGTNTEKGEWDWEDGKSELELKFDGETMTFEILRLTNKELNMEDEDRQEWEFEKN